MHGSRWRGRPVAQNRDKVKPDQDQGAKTTTTKQAEQEGREQRSQAKRSAVEGASKSKKVGFQATNNQFHYGWDLEHEALSATCQGQSHT